MSFGGEGTSGLWYNACSVAVLLWKSGTWHRITGNPLVCISIGSFNFVLGY